MAYPDGLVACAGTRMRHYAGMASTGDIAVADKVARRIHVLTFAFYVMTIGYAYRGLTPIVPPFHARVSGAIFVAIFLMWIAAFLWRHLRARRILETPNFEKSFYLAHMWLYNFAILAGFWILMPYADDAVRLLGVMFTLGAIAVEAFATAQTASIRWLSKATPYGPALGLCLYFIVYGGRFSVIIIAFVIVLTALLVMFRSALQLFIWRSLRAHSATKEALGQVAAERDARTRFLAAASHDLAQPLQAARMFADAVVRQPAGSKRDKAIANLGWAFDSTEHLLDQMLDHLRPDGGTTEIHLGEITIGQLLAQIAAMHEPHAAAIGVSIDALPSSLIAHADARLVERTISNFIANALRHAKARRILVGARRHGPALRIWVIDDGTGVSARDAARLFDDGFQGSDHRDEVRGGFGLGLASARRAGELIGGTVGFDQRWQKGSAFYLELSRACAVSRTDEILPDL